MALTLAVRREPSGGCFSRFRGKAVAGDPKRSVDLKKTGTGSSFLRLRNSGPEGRNIPCRWRKPPEYENQQPEA